MIKNINLFYSSSLDLLHKYEKGEAFADKKPDFTDK